MNNIFYLLQKNISVTIVLIIDNTLHIIFNDRNRH